MLHKKKTLLFVNGHLNTGGIEKTLVDLLSIIDYSRFDVDLLLFERGGDYASQVPREVRVLSVDLRNAYGPFTRVAKDNFHLGGFYLIYYRVISSLTNLFGDKAFCLLRPILPVGSSYDCAIAYRTGFCASVVAYSIRAIKKLCWWHNGEFNFSGTSKERLRRTFSRFSEIVAVSEGWKRFLANEFPDLSTHFCRMYNVLNADSLALYADSYPEEFIGVKYPILSVGNLTKRKHFDNIVYVCKRLMELGERDFCWFIIGAGEEYDHIASLIKESGVNQHLKLIGKRTNPYPFINNASLFVHPSYGEAHCTVILEAMALKTPCVVTKTVVPQDFTEDKVNCIEVDRSPDALFEGVHYLMHSPQKATMLADAAYSQVTRDYSPEVIAGYFYEIVES